jgi:uncharacterized protein (DUF433 family)
LSLAPGPPPFKWTIVGPEAAAARLLRVAPSTLHSWLEGRPPRYRPVIRVEPTGSRNVTWAEFVEAGLLRSYRREHDVPLKELREFIDRLCEGFQVPYPLADRRPYVGSGRRLLIDLQDRSHLDPEFCLVAIANGQTVLTAPGEEFFERVDWSGDQPAGWRPHEDPASPIRINPLVRFGMPAIGGISTEAIAGELDGGASLEEVAEDFGLDLDAVRWAQSYELSQHAAASACGRRKSASTSTRTFSDLARSSAVSATTSPIRATPEPSSTSGTGHLAPSRALMCSTRTGYPRWPPGDG